MKKTSLTKRLCAASARSTLIAAALLGAVAGSYGQAPAPTDSYTNSFPNDGGQPHSWINWYGYLPGNGAMVFDATKDAANNAGSGSLVETVTFAGNNQQVFFGSFQNINPYNTGGIVYNAYAGFTNVEFDILVDPSSIANSFGTFGPINATLVDSGWNSPTFNDANSIIIPGEASNGWVHVGIPIIPGQALFSNPGAAGICFRFSSFGSGNPQLDGNFRLGGTLKFWIDNITVKFSGAPPPPPPPPAITDISRPFKNLNFFTGSPGDYSRSGMRGINTDAALAMYSWVGVASPANPVTYEFTVTDYPGAGHGGFHTYIYLVPAPLVGANDNNLAPDYQEPNVVYLSLDLDGAGAATYTFRWKTNVFAGNGYNAPTNIINHYYESPHQFVTHPTAVGTWKCTFSNDTTVTLVSPSGSKTNFVIDPNLAAYFNSRIYFYFGVHADTADADKGIATAISHLGVSGAIDTIDASFTDGTALDTVNVWQLEAVAPQGVFVMPPETEKGLIITWPQLNSTGFILQTNSVLNGAGFSTNGLPGPLSLGFRYRTLLSTNDVDVNATRYLRLAKPGS